MKGKDWFMCQKCGNITSSVKCEVCGTINEENKEIDPNEELGDYNMLRYEENE